MKAKVKHGRKDSGGGDDHRTGPKGGKGKKPKEKK